MAESCLYDFSPIANSSPSPSSLADSFTRKLLLRGFSTKVNPSRQGRLPPNITYHPPPHFLSGHYQLIQGMIDAGILQSPSVPLRKCILNHYFLIRKPDGSLRLIFDGRRVNRCMHRPPPFSLHNISHITSDITHQDHSHASELDLTSAYYQIRVHPSFRRFLCISTSSHGILQFARLPMGMSWASFCLHKAVTSTIRTSPFPSATHTYADNIYPLGPSAPSTLHRLRAVQAHLEQHGWVFNTAKTRTPFTAGDVLGIHVDLTARTTQPTSSFRSTLRAAAARLLQHPTRGAAQRVLGSTIWAAQATPDFLRFTHHIVHAIRHADSPPSAPVPLSPALVHELRALSLHALTSPPTPIPEPLPPPQHVIYSDASSSTSAFSHVAPHALLSHVSHLSVPSLSPSTSYLQDIQHTVAFPADPALHITEQESVSLSAALSHADENKLPDTLFAVDSAALFFAVRKGRSNNPGLFSSACERAAERETDSCSVM